MTIPRPTEAYDAVERHYATVTALLRAGLPIDRRDDPRGRDCLVPRHTPRTWSRITDDDVDTIKECRAEGMTFRKIAEAFGISETYVWRICKNERRSRRKAAA